MNNQQATMQIKNPEMNVPKTPQMNERDFLNDMLTTEKYMTISYATAIHEASHQKLYQDILNIYNETQNCQRQLYNVMFQKGFYAIDPEQQAKLQQSYQQFSGYQNQLPVHGQNQNRMM